MNLIAGAPIMVKVQMFLGFAMNLAILWLLFLSPGRTWFQRTAKKTIG
jgi:hypothetical protein